MSYLTVSGSKYISSKSTTVTKAPGSKPIVGSASPVKQPTYVSGSGRLTYSSSSPVYERRPVYGVSLDEAGYSSFVEEKVKGFEKETGAERKRREAELKQVVGTKEKYFVGRENIARQLEAGSPVQSVIKKIQGRREQVFVGKQQAIISRAEADFSGFFESKKGVVLKELESGRKQFERTEIIGYETVPVGTQTKTITKYTMPQQFESFKKEMSTGTSVAPQKTSFELTMNATPIISSKLSNIELGRLSLGLTKEGKIDYSKGQSVAPMKTITSEISKRPTDPVGMFLGSIEYAVGKTPQFLSSEYQRFAKGGEELEEKITKPIIKQLGVKESSLIAQQFRGGVGLVTTAPALGTGVLLGASRSIETGAKFFRWEFDTVYDFTTRARTEPVKLVSDVRESGLGFGKEIKKEASIISTNIFGEARKGTVAPLIPFKSLRGTRTESVLGLVGTSLATSAIEDPRLFASQTFGSQLTFYGAGRLASRVSRIGALKAEPILFKEPGRGLVEGGIVKDVPVLERFSSGKLIPIKQQASSKVLSDPYTSIISRKGKDVIVQRVAPFNITNPKTYVDKLLGRTPGQIKQQFFAQKQVLLLKDTPSQFAGKNLDSLIGGKELYVAQVSPKQLPFTKGIIGQPRFVVQQVPGASGPRLFAGGTERGLFLAPETIKGQTQAYIYYASQKGSFYDVLSGKVGVSVKGVSPRIFLARETVQKTPGLLKVSPTKSEVASVVGEVKARGFEQTLSGYSAKDLALYARLARQRGVAGTIQSGAAAQAGIRGEFEASASLGTIFERASIGTRGLVKNVFGLSDVRIYYPTKDILFGLDLGRMIPTTAIPYPSVGGGVGKVESGSVRNLVSSSNRVLLPYDISGPSVGVVSGLSIASKRMDSSVVSERVSKPVVISSRVDKVSYNTPVSDFSVSKGISTSFVSEPSVFVPSRSVGPSFRRVSGVDVSFGEPSFNVPSVSPSLPSYDSVSYVSPSVSTSFVSPRKSKRSKERVSKVKLVRPVFGFKQPKTSVSVVREKRLRNIILPIKTDWLKAMNQYNERVDVKTIGLLPSKAKGFRDISKLLGV